MHVVALNHVYRPSEAATAQLLTELCEGLVGRGHRVTVVTARVRDGDPADAIEHGVRVLRVGATRLGKARLWRRAVDYATFYAGTTRALAALRDVDVYLPLTTPPLVALCAQAFAGRTPVVSLVQDLYPDVAVALGAVRAGSGAHRAWAAATRASLRASARVIALSRAMAVRLRGYGVPADRLDVIPNWALGELEHGAATGAEARLEHGLGERFVVMYSGNMGAAHSFDTLLAAAERLGDRSDIAFVFVGDGLRRDELARAARRLPNVRLFPLAARARLAESLAMGDLHVVTMRDGVDGLIVPSKLYGILAAARPVLAIGPRGSDVTDVIAAAAAGEAVANGDVDGVVAAVTRTAALSDRGRAVGLRGRAYLLAELTREHALDRYEHSLSRAARARAAHSRTQSRSAP